MEFPQGGHVKLTRTKIVLAAMMVLFSVGLFAQANSSVQENQSAQSHRFHPGMMDHMGRYLQLSDAQEAQVKQIMANEKPTITPLMQQLHENQKQLRDLEQRGTFDEAKVRALAVEQAQIQTNLTVEKSRTRTQIFALLTPEQKTKAIEMSNRREQRFQKHVEQKAEPVQ